MYANEPWLPQQHRPPLTVVCQSIHDLGYVPLVGLVVMCAGSIRSSAVLARQLRQLPPILPDTSAQLRVQGQGEGALQAVQGRLVLGEVLEERRVRRRGRRHVPRLRLLARLRPYEARQRPQVEQEGRRAGVQGPRRRLQTDAEV